MLPCALPTSSARLPVRRCVAPGSQVQAQRRLPRSALPKPSGRYGYTVKKSGRRASRVRFMTPVERLDGLCALVPPPYHSLTGYHGVIAPRARLRNAVVPQPPRDVRPSCSGDARAPYPFARSTRMCSWRSLLQTWDLALGPPAACTALRRRWRWGASVDTRTLLRVSTGKRSCSWVPHLFTPAVRSSRRLSTRSRHKRSLMQNGQCRIDNAEFRMQRCRDRDRRM